MFLVYNILSIHQRIMKKLIAIKLLQFMVNSNAVELRRYLRSKDKVYSSSI